MVETVLGRIEADELGFVLPHEHVFLDMYEITLNSNLILSDVALAISELQEARKAGITSIIDQTIHGLFPNPESLRDVSTTTGLNIVTGTGFYWEKFHPSWLKDLSQVELVNLLVKDLTVGLLGTDVKAGILGEIGTHHRRVSPAEERVLKACAVAQREVPVPITTHALFTRIGLEQLEILESAGARLDHTVIGHADTVPDVSYHELLLSRGAWIAYDSIGQLDKQSDEARADALVYLIGAGHIGHLLISSDVCKRPALRAYGGPGYAHIVTGFLPLLRSRGVSEQQISTLTVDNPRSLFEM
jgi:phosphotriesterase-related protein